MQYGNPTFCFTRFPPQYYASSRLLKNGEIHSKLVQKYVKYAKERYLMLLGQIFIATLAPSLNCSQSSGENVRQHIQDCSYVGLTRKKKLRAETLISWLSLCTQRVTIKYQVSFREDFHIWIRRFPGEVQSL